MSRIDEALRRAGTGVAIATAGAASPDEVFASPWAVAGDSPAAARREPLADPHAPVRAVMRSPVDRFKASWRERLVSPGVDPALVDQFRRLAATLLHSQRAGRMKVIMVTSAVMGEGKTLTALNLALVLSDSYRRRVLLIDGDLRRPRISDAANLGALEGLAEAIRGGADRKLPLVQLTEMLTFLPAGGPDPDPLSGLTSSQMQRLLEEAAEQFDWVIIDTPPVNVAADAGLLCALVDAALLVVRAGQTPHDAIEGAIATLGRERIFGVVMNGVARPDVHAYGEYVDDIVRSA